MKKSQFVYVAYIRTTPQKLWAALTQPEFTQRYAQFGRASNAVLQVKLPVSIQTAAEAANCFVVCFLVVAFNSR